MNKWIRMTALASLLFASAGAMAAAPAAAAPKELAGVWQGKLPIDASTSLTIQFTFAKDAKGGYTAVLDSPENGAIKNTPATGVTWDGSNLEAAGCRTERLPMPRTLKDGKIDGQWTQPGGIATGVEGPYNKPVMSKARWTRSLVAGLAQSTGLAPQSALRSISREE
jgi:hypothetical protein